MIPDGVTTLACRIPDLRGRVVDDKREERVGDSDGRTSLSRSPSIGTFWTLAEQSDAAVEHSSTQDLHR
jgi:hypothetical protein